MHDLLDEYNTGWTRNKIIEMIARNNQIIRKAKSIDKSYADDLLQELYLHFCKMPEPTLRDKCQKGIIYRYACTFFFNVYNSNDSKLNIRKFTKRNSPLSDEIFDEMISRLKSKEDQLSISQMLEPTAPYIRELMNKFWYKDGNEILSKDQFYHKAIWDAYINSGGATNRSVADRFKLPLKTINHALQKTHKEISVWLLQQLNNTNFYDNI